MGLIAQSWSLPVPGLYSDSTSRGTFFDPTLERAIASVPLGPMLCRRSSGIRSTTLLPLCESFRVGPRGAPQMPRRRATWIVRLLPPRRQTPRRSPGNGSLSQQGRARRSRRVGPVPGTRAYVDRWPRAMPERRAVGRCPRPGDPTRFRLPRAPLRSSDPGARPGRAAPAR